MTAEKLLLNPLALHSCKPRVKLNAFAGITQAFSVEMGQRVNGESA